jgi:hypothetical protein
MCVCTALAPCHPGCQRLERGCDLAADLVQPPQHLPYLRRIRAYLWIDLVNPGPPVHPRR